MQGPCWDEETQESKEPLAVLTKQFLQSTRTDGHWGCDTTALVIANHYQHDILILKAHGQHYAL